MRTIRFAAIALIATLCICALGVSARADNPSKGDFGSRLGLGVTVAKDTFRPVVSYDLLSKPVRLFTTSSKKLSALQSINLGIFASETSSRWDRVDFGPEVNYTYGKVFVGFGYHPTKNQGLLSFGVKF